MAHAEWARLLAQDEAERAAVFEGGAPGPQSGQRPALVVVQVDGTGVRDRSTHASMGTKVGVVYTGVAEVSRKRRELVGKRCVASFGTAERFGELLWLEAARFASSPGWLRGFSRGRHRRASPILRSSARTGPSFVRFQRLSRRRPRFTWANRPARAWPPFFRMCGWTTM